MSGKLSIDIVAFKAITSGTLVGFATIRIRELHLVVRDLTIHQKGDRRWCGLPGKAQVDRQGVAQRDENGKIRYVAVLEFDDGPTRKAFSAKVIEALERYDANAFAGAAA
jgi:hypothetical protein